jgi:hypothetical protein
MEAPVGHVDEPGVNRNNCRHYGGTATTPKNIRSMAGKQEVHDHIVCVQNNLLDSCCSALYFPLNTWYSRSLHTLPYFTTVAGVISLSNCSPRSSIENNYNTASCIQSRCHYRISATTGTNLKRRHAIRLPEAGLGILQLPESNNAIWPVRRRLATVDLYQANFVSQKLRRTGPKPRQSIQATIYLCRRVLSPLKQHLLGQEDWNICVGSTSEVGMKTAANVITTKTPKLSIIQLLYVQNGRERRAGTVGESPGLLNPYAIVSNTLPGQIRIPFNVNVSRHDMQQIATDAWKVSNPVPGLVIIQQVVQSAPKTQRVQQPREEPRYRMRMSAGHELRELPDGTIIRGKDGATFAGYIPAQANKNKKRKDKENEKQTQAEAVTPAAPCSTPVESPKSKSASLPPITSASAAAAITATLGLNTMVGNHQAAASSTSDEPTQLTARQSRKRKTCKLQ